MPRTLTNLTGATTNDKVGALPFLDMSKMRQTDVSADHEHHPKVRIALSCPLGLVRVSESARGRV
jgi:hypothetical protein